MSLKTSFLGGNSWQKILLSAMIYLHWPMDGTEMNVCERWRLSSVKCKGRDLSAISGLNRWWWWKFIFYPCDSLCLWFLKEPWLNQKFIISWIKHGVWSGYEVQSLTKKQIKLDSGSKKPNNPLQGNFTIIDKLERSQTWPEGSVWVNRTCCQTS